MTESKGPDNQDRAAKTAKPATPAKPAKKKRKGPLDRLRPYAVGTAAMVVVFGASALIGEHVRSTHDDKISEPNGAAAAPASPGPTLTAGPTPTESATPSGPKLSVPVRPAVPVTITVFEDLRSPDSKAFHDEYDAAFSSLLTTGQAQIYYRLVTTSDQQYGGTGAKIVSNAAACAQDQGRFPQFVGQVFDNQPAPENDSLSKETQLKKLAKKTGKINIGKFEPCVEQADHEGWVLESQRQFAALHLGDAPVLQIDGVTVKNVRTTLTPKKLRSMVLAEAKRVIAQKAAEAATPTPTPTS